MLLNRSKRLSETLLHLDARSFITCSYLDLLRVSISRSAATSYKSTIILLIYVLLVEVLVIELYTL